MLSAWRSWCRLCGKQQSDIDIFIKTGNISDISKAIQKYLSITITPCKKMPTMICAKCHEYVTSLMQFAEQCIKIDTMFSELALANKYIDNEDLQQLRSHYGIDNDDFTVVEPIDMCDTDLSSDDDSTIDATYVLQVECGAGDESDIDNSIVKEKQTTRPKKTQRSKTKRVDKNQKCEKCDIVFTRTSSLSRHLNTFHGIREKTFTCELCGKTFFTKSALTKHKHTHEDKNGAETPFQCPICPKKFKNMNLLKMHEDVHNDTNYLCPHCGLQLNTKRTLQMHMVIHSDQKNYKCQFCGNEYKRAKALKNHLILHSGLKPYSCPFCDKTFANGSNCRSHKKKSHPAELAALEASGGVRFVTNIPKLDQLQAVPSKEIQELCENPSQEELTTTDVKK